MADQTAPVANTSSAPARTLGTPLATIIALLTSIVGLIVLAWAILYITKGRFLKHTFENFAGRMAERDIRVAGDFQFYFDPFDLKFRAEGLTVSNPAWAGPRQFFTSKLIDTRLATFASVFGRRKINSLLLDGAAVDTEWDKDGKRNTWTFGDPNAQGEPFEMPIIKTGAITGTTIRYRDPRMLLSADIGVETVKAKDTRFASAINFSGKGIARNNPFTISGALLSPNATISGGQNQLDMRILGARTNARIWGTLPGATDLEGSKLNVDVRGRNMADLFSVAGVAVPDTRTYRLRSALTKAGDEWRFTRLKGVFGDSDVAGWLTVLMREPRLKLTAELATQTLDIVDVAPFIGYNPDLVASQGFQAAVSQPGTTPRILPDAPLRVEALSNFDAAVKYTVRRVRAKSFPVSNIALTLGLNDRLLKLSPLTFDMARGHVSSDIAINARKNPVFTDYDIRLSPTPIGRLFAGFGLEESGTTGTIKARIQMTGSGNSVRDSLATSNGRIAVILPKGNFWTRNIQLAELDVGTFVQKLFEDKLKKPVQINCGLIGFSVRNGIAAADPILIDTQKNVMLGRGGFSFRDESLDLAVRADGKKFSLFSGQSPVGIDGYFAAPGIKPISPELLTRAGAGLGLAIVGTPLAAVIAFVDIGDAKAADCGPVLSGASARSQRTDKGKPRDDVGKGTPAKSEDGKKDGKFLGIF